MGERITIIPEQMALEAPYVQYITPAPDSHFRLIPCKCGSDDVLYRANYDPYDRKWWRVVCKTCGRCTRPNVTQHYAQIEWNGREKPSWDRD